MLVVVVMGGLLPSPLYVIYAARLGLSSLQLTVLFAVYAIGVLAALVSVGHLSEGAGASAPPRSSSGRRATSPSW